jgi:ABC-type thiamine transport system substrate-binding protein
MKQVKMFASDKKANKWLRENKNKEIMNITFDAGYFAIIYEEVISSPNKKSKK